MMDIHQVNSKETALSEDDIVIVSAFMTSPTLEVQESAKKHGVTPERLLYTVYVQQMQNPALIRIREGNTLFTMAALEGRQGFVMMYNGDVEENVAENFEKFLQAAHTMGFNVLVVKCVDDSLNRSGKQIQKDVQDAEFVYNKVDEVLYVRFNQPHGD
jgi:hypothetical protein